MKGNTKEHVLTFYESSSEAAIINKEEVIKIKFEVDVNPPCGATYETKFGLLPSPYQVRLYDMSSLFAGKIHAILCRTYKNNVKGRDYYDFLFFIRKRVKPNLEFLKNKLIETGKLTINDEFDTDIVKQMLINKIKTVDFAQIKNDAQKFIFKNENLDYFSRELFIDIIQKL